MISKTEFVDWRKDPVTLAFLETIELRIKEIQENLVVSAGLEPLSDRFYVGMVHAYNEVRNVAIEEMETTDA